MRIRRQYRIVAAFCLVLAAILMQAGVSEAVKGQYYAGDGAVPNATIPPGGWLEGSVDAQCLACHNTSQTFGAPDKTSYLMTGHKNMLRKALSGLPRTGPDGLVQDTDSTGFAFDWLSAAFSPAALLDRGSCSLGTSKKAAECTAAGGVWTEVQTPLFYIYDGWMNKSATGSSIASPSAVYGGICSNGTSTTASSCATAGGAWTNGSSYSCARCHTTGFTLDTAVTTTRPPELTYPGITRTGSAKGHVSFDPDGGGPAIAGSWAVGAGGTTLEGVQCERCHDASRHFSGGGPTKPVGVDATLLCVNCHRQEHTDGYGTCSLSGLFSEATCTNGGGTWTVGGGLGSNVHPTPFSDNGPLPASEPDFTLPAVEVGGHGTYAPEFYGHSTGMEYLNSAHGQFSGNFQQVTDLTKYNSVFVKEGTGLLYPGEPVTEPRGGGCVTCHDVHQSTVAAVNAEAPFKKQCPDCHFQGSLISMANIKHPTGAGTPLGDLSDIAAACVTCHMPKPYNGEGLTSHLWRINVDAGYRTFPTEGEWNAGQKTAFTAPMGEYANAVWIDLDLACGQCHGGGTDQATNPAKASGYYFTKAQLQTYATNMHDSVPVARFLGTTDSFTSYKVNFDARNSTCPDGATCNYAWEFGDGTTGTGVTTSHTYDNATTRTVKLTVDTYGTYYTSASTTQSVTPVVINQAPTAAGLSSAATNNYTVSFTDASVDAAGNSPAGIALVKVNWGDGSVSTGVAAGDIFSHTYASASSYTIMHTATNAAGMSASESRRVAVPQKFSITGSATRTGTGLSGVTMILKFNGTTKATTTTAGDGTYTFGNILAGTYVVQPFKSGTTFTPSTRTVTVGPSAVGVDFTAL